MTTTDNKLIADFMNSKISENNYFINGMYKEVNNLKYDTDWNWLMEVVEKIESLEANFEIKSNWNPFSKITMHQTTIKIFKHVKIITTYNSEEIKTIYTNPSENKLENTYNACIEFIKWHNK